ncbi:MAG TPA: LPS assembly lipoprotein LptE [Candidatus Binatia bacterium]|nr:LPS assembly lipoprotein LptE [Candidatus Binatia bacterium]
MARNSRRGARGLWAIAAASVAVGALGTLGACGYHFPGQVAVLPGGGSKVYVARFDNRTRNPGVENDVLEAMQLEVARRGQFTLAPNSDAADLVLEGTINSIEVRPIAFSTSDEALQFETVMTLSVQLRNPHTGKIVWRVAGLRENDSYGAVSQTVVASSSQFLSQSTLNANDLNQLTDVQLSESQRREALDRVLENASRDVYNSMVEDF